MHKLTKWLIVLWLIGLVLPVFTACSATAAPAGKTVSYKVQLTNKQADGYIIPIGKVNVVCVVTDVGLVGCGAFDVMALDSFSYPAVKVKSSNANPIATIDDLQNGTVKEVNAAAAKLGIKVGMTGREALDLM